MTIPLHSTLLPVLKRPLWSWLSCNNCWLENKAKPMGKVMLARLNLDVGLKVSTMGCLVSLVELIELLIGCLIPLIPLSFMLNFELDNLTLRQAWVRRVHSATHWLSIFISLLACLCSLNIIGKSPKVPSHRWDENFLGIFEPMLSASQIWLTKEIQWLVDLFGESVCNYIFYSFSWTVSNSFWCFCRHG